MGYETEVPPVPTRDEELIMISKIKKSFESQPYYKFYMNESLRTRKIEHWKGVNTFQISFLGNFIRGSFFSMFFLMPVALLYRKSSFGVPMFFKAKHFITGGGSDLAHEFRNYKIYKFFIPATIASGLLYASSRTSIEPIMDEFYENKSVILPY